MPVERREEGEPCLCGEPLECPQGAQEGEQAWGRVFGQPYQRCSCGRLWVRESEQPRRVWVLGKE